MPRVLQDSKVWRGECACRRKRKQQIQKEREGQAKSEEEEKEGVRAGGRHGGLARCQGRECATDVPPPP